MKVKWSNIIVFILALIALIIFIQNDSSIAVFFNSSGHSGSRRPSREWISGFEAIITIGVLLITIVAILKNRKGN